MPRSSFPYDPDDRTIHLPPGHRARIIEIEPIELPEPEPLEPEVEYEYESPTIDGDHDDWDDE